MPKLDAKNAKAVEAADAAGSFLMPAGRYAAQLRSVKEEAGDEFPYWVWEFENLHDEDGVRHPGRQWNNTSLSPKSRGFMKAVFEAFGYEANSDTDEMIGEWVVLYVEQETQQKGKNAGKLRNNVARLAPFDEAEWDFDPEAAASSFAASGGGEEGDDF